MTTVPLDAPVCLVCKDKYGVSTFKPIELAQCFICATTNTACYHADVEQQIDPDQYRSGSLDFTRAAAASVCRQCAEEYRKHPLDRRPEAASYNGEPFLHVLCNGNLVKL